MASALFDPHSIPIFSVVRVPYQFPGEPVKEKFFVLLAHQSSYAIFIKSTSKIELYKNNPDKMKGCVYYPSGTLPCFPENTVIQPDNQIPIHHDLIRKAHTDGVLEVHQTPPSFEADLRSAIAKSVTLTPEKRTRLLKILPQIAPTQD